ncbi:AraC family transcriptional regulator [Dyadobacter sp. CY351]|uniref:helix-turn-helix domain-containing protein n=1 Tax=Dyadobacter sp. CY351 TaxID=2909337 RepID=UPI001F2F7273|nr:AraC family transcriptional regulator [Dyadobacter sp. CY351]MCF2518808.1 AraC family transcriptional regulator [Dyadobacter sp. CY351]
MKPILDLQSFYSSSSAPSEISKDTNGHFNIIKVEDLQVSGGKPVSFTRRSYYKVSLVSGHSKIHYADQTFEVTESALVFTNPLIPYFWEPVDPNQTGLICIFTEDFFNGAGSVTNYPIFNSSGQGIVPLDAIGAEHFKEIFIKMQRELDGGYLFKYDLLRSMLIGLIHEAQKLQPAFGAPMLGSNAFERITQLFKELLERQFPIEVTGQRIKLNSPTAFANQLNIHVNHLNKALKEITGNTTSTLIAGRIIQEAKILLKGTVWPVNEISWSLGFEEPNHFSAFFRRNTGIKPKQFRQLSTD